MFFSMYFLLTFNLSGWIVDTQVLSVDGGVDFRILNYLQYYSGMYEVELVCKKLESLGDDLDCRYVATFLRTFGKVEQQMVLKYYQIQKDQRPAWMLDDELLFPCLHILLPCHHEFVQLSISDTNRSRDGFTLADIIDVARHMHDQSPLFPSFAHMAEQGCTFYQLYNKYIQFEGISLEKWRSMSSQERIYDLWDFI